MPEKELCHHSSSFQKLNAIQLISMKSEPSMAVSQSVSMAANALILVLTTLSFSHSINEYSE
jgi:hypothetical protein